MGEHVPKEDASAGGLVDDAQFWEREHGAPILRRNAGFLPRDSPLPDALRARISAWPALCGADSDELRVVQGCCDDEAALRIFERDAERTFVHEDYRQRMMGLLRRVWPENRDYHQGEGYVCSLLMLLFDEETVMRMLLRLTRESRYTPGYWRAAPEPYVRDAMVYARLVNERFPQARAHGACAKIGAQSETACCWRRWARCSSRHASCPRRTPPSGSSASASTCYHSRRSSTLWRRANPKARAVLLRPNPRRSEANPRHALPPGISHRRFRLPLQVLPRAHREDLRQAARVQGEPRARPLLMRAISHASASALLAHGPLCTTTRSPTSMSSSRSYASISPSSRTTTTTGSSSLSSWRAQRVSTSSSRRRTLGMRSRHAISVRSRHDHGVGVCLGGEASRGGGQGARGEDGAYARARGGDGGGVE